MPGRPRTRCQNVSRGVLSALIHVPGILGGDDILQHVQKKFERCLRQTVFRDSLHFGNFIVAPTVCGKNGIREDDFG